jgi:hypothetical protein
MKVSKRLRKPKPPDPLKLTKRDRRGLIAEAAKQLLQKAMGLGYQLWRPGEIVYMSDRSYLVRRDGSWKRLDPGMIVHLGRADHEVGPKGKLKFLGVRPERKAS